MKKQVKRRFFTAVMAAVFTVSGLSLTGCGSKADSEKADINQKSFTYWAPMVPSVASRIESFNDIEMYKKMEEETGVHIEFIHPPVGQEKEQFNLLIASRDLPDMIEYNWNAFDGGPQAAIDQDIIYPLNEYIESSAPNFKKAISEGEYAQSYDKGSKTDTGEYFAFPCFNVGEDRIFGGAMIRKDWLDELGLDIPETIDEWTNVLTAFKEKKGAEAPLTGTATYFMPGTHSVFNGAFDVAATRLYVEDGKVKFSPYEKGYKEYITLLHDWYKKGLLDKDFSNIQGTAVDSKMLNGTSGAVIGYLGGSMGKYLKQMESTDPKYNLVCAPYPVKEKGQQNHFGMYQKDVSQRYVAITKNCKDPEGAVKWLDKWYGKDGYMLMNFGVEGSTYNMQDGKPVYTDKILHNPDGLSINEALSLDCRATSAAPGFQQAPEYLEQYYEYPQQVEGFKMWAATAAVTRDYVLPDGVFATADEEKELAALNTDISTYVSEMYTKFVTGDEPLDNYDNFLATLKDSLNADRYIEIQQNMYDRYLKR